MTLCSTSSLTGAEYLVLQDQNSTDTLTNHPRTHSLGVCHKNTWFSGYFTNSPVPGMMGIYFYKSLSYLFLQISLSLSFASQSLLAFVFYSIISFSYLSRARTSDPRRPPVFTVIRFYLVMFAVLKICKVSSAVWGDVSLLGRFSSPMSLSMSSRSCVRVF